MEKPLKTKQQSSARSKNLTFDDPLTGAPRTFKRPSTYPVVNTITTFPPPIPHASSTLQFGGGGSSGPRAQREMERSAVNAPSSEKEEQLGMFESICFAIGIQSKKTQKTVQKTHERKHTKTIQRLEKTIGDIIIQKEHQSYLMQTAQHQMQVVESQLAQFLARENATKDHPLFVNFVTQYNHQAQQYKNAQRAFALLENGQLEASKYKTNISAEEYQNQINKIILEHHNSSKDLGLDSKQMKNMIEVNKVTQKQAMRQELKVYMSPPPAAEEELQLSQDVLRMVARCDAMASSIRQGGSSSGSKPPSPPPPPTGYLDDNLLLQEQQTSGDVVVDQEGDGGSDDGSRTVNKDDQEQQ